MSNGRIIGPYRALPSSGIWSMTDLQQYHGIADPYDITLLVISGGGPVGPGFYAGGGGAGGMLEQTVTLTGLTTYLVTIGSGGAGQANGSASSFGALLSTSGGGYGSSYATYDGGAGGSGGGGSYANANAGAGISGQGYAGGQGGDGYTGGGGGGAGGAGAATVNGGAGRVSTITGSSVTYAIGGNGYSSSGPGGANTGNGGSGSGIVIAKIPAARYTGKITGSTAVSTSGSFVIVKFLGSGTYIS